MKYLNIIFGSVYILGGLYALIEGAISIKGNVITSEYFVYPIGLLMIGIGLLFFYLTYKGKEIEL
ncbi:hypothetical protein BN3087_330025 [Sulfurovum sp. enrichment culture clone C5]|uniref:Uncharacterized protein n=1 Tax=Sulfurovum sp. enrichment culture clone C5 TaxID=497650 RepID=A0A0S4XNT2_9BACT|nr:hypothetical protein BN3087_330025 [Sulfurovum sp. enrichment culture clone C5]